MAWKDKLNVFSRKGVDRQIGDQTWHFYPVSVRALFQMRATVLPVVEAFSVLFARNQSDVKQDIEEIKSVTEGSIVRTTIDGIDTNLAKYRAKQRGDALEKAVSTIMADSSRISLGRLLADSLRDEFEKDCPDSEIEAFMDTLDMAMLVEFLMGFAEANMEVFGPLGKRAVATAKAKVETALDEQEKNPNGSESVAGEGGEVQTHAAS